MKVGFIGLGIMGSRMASHLLQKSEELYIYNRNPEKADSLASKGAIRAESVEFLAAKVDIVFTMLSTPKVVEDTAKRILPNLKDNSW